MMKMGKKIYFMDDTGTGHKLHLSKTESVDLWCLINFGFDNMKEYPGQ